VDQLAAVDMPRRNAPNRYVQLVNGIDAFFRSAPPFRRYGELATLLQIAGRDGWSSFLEGVDSGWTEEEAGSSADELIGFTKLSLYRSTELGYQLRLHIWWNGRRTFDMYPHEHRWPLASAVMCGQLRIVNFDVLVHDAPAPDAETLISHLLFDGDRDGRKRIEVEGPVGLAPTSDYVVGAGGTHCLHGTGAHQVFNWTDNVSATLVVTGPAFRDFSRSFRGAETAEGATKARAHWTHRDITDTLRRVMTHVEC